MSSGIGRTTFLPFAVSRRHLFRQSGEPQSFTAAGLVLRAADRQVVDQVREAQVAAPIFEQAGSQADSAWACLSRHALAAAMTMVAIRNRGRSQAASPPRTGPPGLAREEIAHGGGRAHGEHARIGRAQSHRARRMIEDVHVIARPDPGPGTEQPAPGEFGLSCSARSMQLVPLSISPTTNASAIPAPACATASSRPSAAALRARRSARPFPSAVDDPSRSPCAASSSGPPCRRRARSQVRPRLP